MKNNHIIGRQRFDIQLNTAAEAKSFFDRISALTHARLNQEIDELLTELAPPGQTIRVDQLVVDIGVLSPSSLEEEVVERVLAGLRVQFRELLEITPGTQDTPLIDQLAHFLQRGFWPWWTSRETEPAPATLLLYLLEETSRTTTDNAGGPHAAANGSATARAPISPNCPGAGKRRIPPPGMAGHPNTGHRGAPTSYNRAFHEEGDS